MTMLEPTTTITDFILAVMSFYFGHMLYRFHANGGDVNARGKRFYQYWGVVFFTMGLGSLLGGISHGFIHLKDTYPMLIRAWPFAIMNLGFVSFYLLLAIAIEYFPRQRPALSFVAYVKLMAFLLLMFGYPKKYFGEFLTIDFKLVIFDYAPILFLLLLTNFLDFVKTNSAPARTMVIAVIVLILGSLVQLSGYAIHPQFNQNDLYHVISMLGIYLMYRSVVRKEIR